MFHIHRPRHKFSKIYPNEFQEAILIRLQGVHFLNAPSYVDRLMMILKPFIKKEHMNRICVHSAGATSIEQLVPIEALPKEAGGRFKSFEEAKSMFVLRSRKHNRPFIRLTTFGTLFI